jgi:MOSC domain-containing protein YiiM
MGKVIAVCTSPDKGMRKKNVGSGKLVIDFGLEGDAHGGKWHRQVSLLAIESIDKMRKAGLDVGPGDFAENITTEGIDLVALPIGSKVKIGDEAIGEVTQIGKECHHGCAIRQQAGDCVMPREGIFIKVLNEGQVKVGDIIEQITGGEG